MYPPLYTIKFNLYSAGGIKVRQFTVQFRSVREIQEFAAIADTLPCSLLVGTDRFQVHATSFMGIFALNCRKPLTVSVDCSEEVFETILDAFRKFLA